jgi:Domain of unknown function (DUF2760)
MGKIGLAIKAFFKTLGNAAFAEQVSRLMQTAALPAPPAAPAPVAPRSATAPDSALVLLAVLQREARLVDFLQESIASYSDAQIGAAVRDVHRDAAKSLERMFALRPVRGEAEGAAVEVPAKAGASVRLVGNVTGAGPWRGTLRHAGWQATKVELPESHLPAESIRVIAPAEVEL